MVAVSRTATVAIAAAGTVIAAAVAVAWFTVPYGTTHVSSSYAVSLGTAGQAAGWADDVFVGTVKERASVDRSEDGLLWTTFEVDVTDTLQGEVGGTVRVAQEGGDDPVRRERSTVGDVPPLQPGTTYVLATRVASDGWHLVPANLTPVEVPGGDSATVSEWRAAVLHPERQEHLHPSEAAEAADPSALYREAQIG
ncbi:hypothetical protein QNO07_18140 [Streptomyces sp. 549]|uniref:hypothetical protein n=1 Tax=Streptomyces sp. 549 TaxID=3049076 RepID=UPI0024C33C1C|nr:hypothetical protein [Streptomyces sp. 549]MDK1475315.1 hypothetical protein [Streptomyces sp. 549]